MSAYQAMARRYRPQNFDDVIGQGHVAQTLKNAITGGRVAHAYLFCGPHGCGKTSMARIFAKALNCTGGPSAVIPADCPIVADISSGQDPDVIEIDGASNNGVEQVRSLREQTAYVPARARFKIYIIDEVHMLSVAAFNALLKTLEEPPPHVKFILATTEPHKLLETVLSRCQRFDFRLVPAPEIAAYLKTLCAKENVPSAEDALDAVAAFSGGSMRDALVLLDQLISFCPSGITREDVERVRGVAGIDVVCAIFDAILRRNCPAGLSLIDGVCRMGTGAGEFLDQLIEYARDLMRVAITSNLDGISTYGPARNRLVEQAKATSLEEILLMLDVLSSARVRVRSRALTNPYVPLEMAIARLAGLDGVSGVEDVIKRIESIAQSGALSGEADVRIVSVDALRDIPAQAAEQRPAPLVTAAPVAPSAAALSTPVAPAAPVVQGDSEAPAAVHAPVAREDASMPTGANAPEAKNQTAADVAESTCNFDALPVSRLASSEEKQPVAPAVEEPVDEPVDEPVRAPVVAEEIPADPLTRLKKRWDDFMGILREGDRKDPGFFHDVLPVAFENDVTLVFRIPGNGAWLLSQLAEKERHARIGAALNRFLGRTVAFRLELGPSGEDDDAAVEDDVAEAPERPPMPLPVAPAAVKPTPLSSSLRERQRDVLRDPAIQELITRFDGQLLNIEESR